VPSLKALRNRIRSVRSTQKITSAMKVVAASRLRHAVERVEAARPYAQCMERVLASLAGRMAGLPGAPPLLIGTGKEETHLLVVATSDRGLAGGFNAAILREARRRIRELLPVGKTVLVLTIGRKGRDGLVHQPGRLPAPVAQQHPDHQRAVHSVDQPCLALPAHAVEQRRDGQLRPVADSG
jgi:F-type H+-transporting ATPase subunit gamma